MKYQLFSDLHLEMGKTFPRIPVTADILILAGDIGKVSEPAFQDFIRYCSAGWRYVLYVFGNHEFYASRSMDSIKNAFARFFDEFGNVHLLDNSYFHIENTIIYGFTAWTLPHFATTQMAREYLNDYNKIRTNKGKQRIEDVKKRSNDEINKYVDFVDGVDQMDVIHDIDHIVVVTHFPPLHNGTSSPEFDNSILQPYYSWRSLPAHQKTKVWCSGHTHWNYHFQKNGIQYIANQVGYPGEGVKRNAGDGEFELV